MRRFIRTLLILVPLQVVQSACGGSTEPSIDTSFVGNYQLQSINGQPLPLVVLQQGTSSWSITTDHMLIDGNGSWVETQTELIVQNGASSTQLLTSAGTWVRSVNTLSLTDGKTNSLYATGTFSTNQLELFASGVRLEYAR